MIYGALADLLVVVHGGFVLFVVLGGLLVLWRRWLAWVHLPAAAYGVAIEAYGWICPLTPLENALRRAGGGAGYEQSFVERYIVSLLYPANLTRELQWWLALTVILVNIAIYVLVWRRWHTPRREVPFDRS